MKTTSIDRYLDGPGSTEDGAAICSEW